MTSSRQLAAIMFTDIVGYTSLMGSDEQKAFELLKKNRELQKYQIDKYRGRLIKEIGDGVLASFSTVTDAVMCAGAIQKEAEKVEGLKLRIGIHLGEVVFENNDVFGDGVNIASRLQALAPSGGIFVSEAIYKNIANKREIISEYIREEILKNVSASVKIYEVRVESFPDSRNRSYTGSDNASGKTKSRKILFVTFVVVLLSLIIYFFLSQRSKQLQTEVSLNGKEKSIAVLPFVNMSNDSQQEYFSDGLSEELINMFAKIPELKVIGRTSSFAYKGKNEDLRTIGQQLGAEYLLEGSVRKSGNKIRITAQLIKADEGTHLWSETYDKEMTDIFVVQDQISASVTEALRVTLLSTKPARQTNINTDAYNDFLQGRFFYEESNDTANDGRAIKCFNEAIKKDSTFSLPWTYLSMLSWRESNRSNDVVFAKGKEEAQKALELDPNSGIALVNVAEFLDNEYNFHEALTYIEKAYKLEPENPYVLRNVGRFYTILGRKKESIEICKKAFENDPIQLTAINYLSKAYYFAGDIKKANEFVKTIFKVRQLGDVTFMELFRLNKTQEEPDKYENYGSNEAPFLYIKALNSFESGDKKLSSDYLNKLVNKFPEREYLIAMAFAKTGNTANAITWLENAYKNKSKELVYVKVDPVFKDLQNNNRFKELIHLMNFPE